jgi:nitrite reductase/ring-hydroxylating ferredoxin subunit
MSDMLRSGALERDTRLVMESVYEREIRAALESVWENVLDWEHLPWLHSQAFTSIDLHASGEWGWRAEVGFPGDAKAQIELLVDRGQNHYVARTLEGAGAGGEIWTYLEPVGSDRTKIRVEFWVPMEMQGKVGAAYVGLYSLLWDQDEEMMQAREQASAGRDLATLEDASASALETDFVELGAWDALAPRLPIRVDFRGHAFRVVEIEGRPVAHSVECPHWRGPLGDCPVEAGVVTCPWHGYRFDVGTGQSIDGRSLKLRPAPRVEVDSRTGNVRMVARRSLENPLGV